MRRIVWVSALLALVPPLAGCGGDSAALSSTEFQQQASAICQAGDAELAEKSRSLFGPDGKATPSAEALAAYYTQDALPLARTKLDRIDQLDPPKGDRQKVDRMLTAGRQAVARLDEQLKQDPVAYFMAQNPDPFEDFNALAADLKLDACTSRQ